VGGQVGEGDGEEPSRKCGQDHDEAHGLVEDDGLQGDEPEDADE
jgi:hypothetical protein